MIENIKNLIMVLLVLDFFIVFGFFIGVFSGEFTPENVSLAPFWRFQVELLIRLFGL